MKQARLIIIFLFSIASFIASVPLQAQTDAARDSINASETAVFEETVTIVTEADSITPGELHDSITADSDGPQRLRALLAPGSAATADSVAEHNWWKLLWKGKLSMKDTTVEYPRFIKFCVDVYNWADRVFNSYDTTYVVGTGRRWKSRITFDAWTDSYNINFNHKMPVTLISNPYSTIGVYLQYMAVGINFGVDINNLFFNKPQNHRKWEFSFNCARFNLDVAFNKSSAGTYIRTFGDYKKGHFLREYFPGVSMTTFQTDLYYYFNNFKYANGAAYNFSKFQKKSAGSFIIGLTYSYEDTSLDFTKTPESLLPYLTIEEMNYVIQYNNYALLFGYGHNFVLNKHFLFNVTAIPSVGMMYCTAESYRGAGKLFSLGGRGRISLTYNNGDFFTCLIAKAAGQWYYNDKLSVLSGVENLSLSVGMRF